MKKYLSWILILNLLIILLLGSITGCDSNSSVNVGNNSDVSSDTKSITKYDLAGLPSTIVGNNISVILPYGGTVRNLVAKFTITGVKTTVNGVTQVSGSTPNDFGSPVVYTVYAANGSTKDYTVTVILPASDKDMKTYSLNGTPGQIVGTNISVILPFGTPSLDGLVATYITTGGYVMVDGIKQTSGITPNNFESPVIYTVHATDGSTKDYKVTATIAPNTAKDITAYAIDGTQGVITGTDISVKLPSGTTSLKDLIATFTTTGSKVKIGGAPQTSGATPNNFESPVIYTVYAADGSTKDYKVTATIVPSTAKDITTYSIDGTQGVITGTNISVTLPSSTPSLNGLIATFTTTGSSVKVGDIPQISGITPNNFERPVHYIVYAANGSTKDYTVTATVATTLFKPYYPVGCTLNNQAAGITGTCECIQDVNTGNIWTTKSQFNNWNSWCVHDNTQLGYNKYCPYNDNSLDDWNSKPQCGITGGWHMPTAPNPNIYNPLSLTNPGGDWSDVYNIAIISGEYAQGGNLVTWMNNNGFSEVQADRYYWTANARASDMIYVVNMSNSIMSSSNYGNWNYVLLVYKP